MRMVAVLLALTTVACQQLPQEDRATASLSAEAVAESGPSVASLDGTFEYERTECGASFMAAPNVQRIVISGGVKDLYTTTPFCGLKQTLKEDVSYDATTFSHTPTVGWFYPNGHCSDPNMDYLTGQSTATQDYSFDGLYLVYIDHNNCDGLGASRYYYWRKL